MSGVRSDHTAGPWEAVQNAVNSVDILSGETVVAQVISEKDEITEGDIEWVDALLLAAAPDLLAFVQRYRDEAEATGGWKGDDDLFSAAVAAIAKAEGR